MFVRVSYVRVHPAIDGYRYSGKEGSLSALFPDWSLYVKVLGRRDSRDPGPYHDRS